MTTDIEMLTLPEELSAYIFACYHRGIQSYARAVSEHNVAARDAEIEALRAEVSGLRAARIGYASEFPPTEDGDPDVGNIHANIRAMKARADQLQAELDNRWAQGVHTCHDKCQRVACVLRRDNKRLTEALRPLAGLDLRPDGFDKRDDSQPVYARDKSEITVGDVRRAVAALRDHDQEGGNG